MITGLEPRLALKASSNFKSNGGNWGVNATAAKAAEHNSRQITGFLWLEARRLPIEWLAAIRAETLPYNGEYVSARRGSSFQPPIFGKQELFRLRGILASYANSQ